MASTINTRIVLRNDNIQQWENSTKILLKGEVALAKRADGSYDLRVGDGKHVWKELQNSFAISADQVIGLSESLDSRFAEKLDKIDFANLSNEIGLSAASSIDKVATQSYVNDAVKDLAGAMHFRDAITPAENQTDKDAIDQAITDPKKGDVVIITTTSKEYVYDGSDWIELGDEILYATKAELTEGLKEEAKLRKEADDYLSSVIDHKVFINGNYAETLSVVNISQDDYHQLVKGGKVDSNTLYIVSADIYNMYDQKIINLADGTESKDAVNFGQITKLSDDIMEEFNASKLSSITLGDKVFEPVNNNITLEISCINCGGADFE